MNLPGECAVFIVGTRAQLIKVAPVIVACERSGKSVILLLTGQHKETMQDLVEEFGIACRPLNAVEVSERSTVFSLLKWMPRAFLGVVRELRKIGLAKAHISVVVHGDTMSTVIGALAAKWHRAKVFHLESGLSSGKLLDPFPEELSRRIVFRLTDVALCPGPQSAAYMSARHGCEVIDTKDNTIVDSVMLATQGSAFHSGNSDTAPYFVASLHRFQNIFDGARLRYLVGFLLKLADHYPVHFVLHPATRTRLESAGLLAQLSENPGIHLSPRLGYGAFLHMASRAACVLTDGGSNQEELAVLGVPTIVMRQHTERLDGLGENAIMEQDLGADLLAYCNSGRFESLRRRPRIGEQIGPSSLVADALFSDV